MSRGEVRSLPFAFVLADEVAHKRLDGWGASYGELEGYRESAQHAEMRHLVVARALRAGLRVFPRSIGIQGIGTFANLLVTDGQNIVFIECLTHPTAKTVARKRQLESVAPVVFIVSPNADGRVLDELEPGQLYVALPHLGTLAVPGTYTGEPCSRCGAFVPRRSYRLYTRIPADEWPDAPWAVRPLGRRALVCAACEPALTEGVRTATKAKWDAAFLEQSRQRDAARFESTVPRVTEELARAWDAFRKTFDHVKRRHAEALPSPSWRETTLEPLSSELAGDFAAWCLGAESRLWNIAAPVAVSPTASDHYDFHRTGTAEAQVGPFRLIVKFEETTEFRFTFAILDGTSRLEGPLAGAARCSGCGAEGCSRCIAYGDYSAPVTEPEKRCRETLGHFLALQLPQLLVTQVHVQGVGPATLDRLFSLNLTVRGVVVRDRWEAAVASIPRLRQKQAELRRRLIPRLLESARYAALPPAKHGNFCLECRGRMWSREQCREAFREGWELMTAEWEGLAPDMRQVNPQPTRHRGHR